MTPVVLSGGSGTRLWPVSRTKLPKQFCQIFDQSLQTLALGRAARLGTPVVLTGQTLHNLTEQNLRQSGIVGASALYEPQGKNTAPAIAFLCQHFMQLGQADEVVAILPADQLIENEDGFVRAIGLAQIEAQNGKVVTLGIQPHHPATGFGYIQTDLTAAHRESGIESHAVLKFHEKPTLDKAQEFLRAGAYFWNAGIFIFKINVMAELFAKFEPEIWATAQTIKPDLSNLAEVYAQFRNISLDYAIMEKIGPELLRCIPADIGWNDVGSWDAVATLLDKTPHGNAPIEVNAKGNYLHGLKGKTYAVVGVDELVIVDTDDALLVSRKGASQDVKTVVDKLKALNPRVVTDHTFEDRPWGRFEVLRDTEQYKSKVIEVSPYQQISYQSHEQREEHWMFIRGRGEVVLDGDVIPVQAGTYVKIPLHAKHRIRNTGPDKIEFIELQLGSYFGEDDITRYQDDYKRI